MNTTPLGKALEAGRDDVEKAFEEGIKGIQVVSDEEAEERENQLKFDFAIQYDARAISDAEKSINTLVLHMIRLRASRDTVNKVLKLIALDNDIIPIVIKKILGK